MKEFKIRTATGDYFNVRMPPGATKEAAIAYGTAHPPAPRGPMDPAPIVYAPGCEPGGLYDRLDLASNRKGDLGGRLGAATKTMGRGMGMGDRFKLLYDTVTNTGPGVMAHGASALQGIIPEGLLGPGGRETPQQVHDRTKGGMETIADIGGGLIAPGRTLGARALSSIAVPFLLKQHEGLGKMFEGGLTGAASQSLAEILMGVVKAGRLGSIAKTVRADFMKKSAEQARQVEIDKVMLKSLEEMDAANYKKLLGKVENEYLKTKAAMDAEHAIKTSDHGNLVAGSLMDEAKKSMPSWADIPSTIDGLLTAVYGAGRDRMRAAFDQGLNNAKDKAFGKLVQLDIKDSQKLNLAIKDTPIPQSQAERFNAINTRGAADSTDLRGSVTKPNDLRLMVTVDAQELIDALPGLTDRRLKDRAHTALFESNLDIPDAVKREYQVGMGTVKIANGSKFAPFNETTKKYEVDPKKLIDWLLDRKNMDEVQNRRMGDHDTLPALVEARKAPVAPAYPPMPVPEPPAPRGPLGDGRHPKPQDPDLPGPKGEKSEIGTLPLPGTRYMRAKAGQAVLGPVGTLLGAIGDAVPIRAPLGNVTIPGLGVVREDLLHQLGPQLLGALFRNMGADTASAATDGPLAPTPPTKSSLTPTEMGELEALLRERGDAPDPRLQLDVAPTE